ncbi:MAG: hypothetical protein ABSD79_01925 [Dehalococcoidales bacterium]|jgi:hypothetical protein
MSLSKENMVEQAEKNVLLDWRWRFCRNFKVGHETKRIVEPSYCPNMSLEYGCIGCTKFQVA